MLTIRKETHRLLDTVERHTGHSLRLRERILTLMELAVSHHQERLLDDLIFLAKFLWNSHNLMQRIGPDAEGYPKLAGEFRDSVEKFSTLVKTLVKEGPDEVKGSFAKDFFLMSPEALDNLMQLAHDLSWLKNYAIDTKRSLFET